jgi:hypothetical protein
VTGSGQGQRVDTCWGWSGAGQRIDEAEAGIEDAGGAEAGTEDVDRKALGRRQTAWAGARMATDSSGQRDDGGRAAAAVVRRAVMWWAVVRWAVASVQKFWARDGMR